MEDYKCEALKAINEALGILRKEAQATGSKELSCTITQLEVAEMWLYKSFTRRAKDLYKKGELTNLCRREDHPA